MQDGAGLGQATLQCCTALCSAAAAPTPRQQPLGWMSAPSAHQGSRSHHKPHGALTPVCQRLDHEENIGGPRAAEPRHRAEQLLVDPAGSSSGRRAGRSIISRAYMVRQGLWKADSATLLPTPTCRSCQRRQTGAAPAQHRCRLPARPGTCRATGRWQDGGTVSNGVHAMQGNFP